MDEFDNFFDDQRQPEPPRTPIYHTPDPKGGKDKATTASIICIIMAVIMCLVVIVNVIVLTTIKDKVATEYAQSMSQQMREEYAKAIQDALNGTNIVDDIKNDATNEAIQALKSSVGLVANDDCAPSVARLYMYESASSLSSPSGLATGFLISDTNASGTSQRYLVTNAHCVRYASEKRSSGLPSFGGIGGWETSYAWASYGKITAKFENDNTTYTLEVVAFGSYTDYDDNDQLRLEAENDQADLALLRFTGRQPSNEEHPSLKIAGLNYQTKRGSAVALIGNPEGIGSTNSISTGIVSQTGVSISSWGNGEFIMTDAAVNSGNSGGPMVDIQGIVVGVVESKLVDEGIDNMGFALSAQTLLNFIDWASQPFHNELHQVLNIEIYTQGA